MPTQPWPAPTRPLCCALTVVLAACTPRGLPLELSPLRPGGGVLPGGATGPLGSGAEPPLPDHYALVGGQVVGLGPAEVEVQGGRVVAVGLADPSAPRIDATGRWITAGIIDSHVHLAYLPEAEALAAGGVAGAVDLAAPVAFFEAELPLPVALAGPMVTTVGGYPTRSWGAAGYGHEVGSVEEARAAVRDHAERGARLIKVPVGGSPALSEPELLAIVEEARALGLPVAAHAIDEAEVVQAARVGVDVLAHTPPRTLSEAALEAWRGRAVISTLSAFGGVETLRALRAHGVEVLYGTDFGNTRARGISAAELGLLLDAGLDGPAILEATQAGPAARWSFPDLGAVEVGARAHLLLLDADPTLDPMTLAAPLRVLRP